MHQLSPRTQGARLTLQCTSASVAYREASDEGTELWLKSGSADARFQSTTSELALPHPHPLIRILIQRTSCQVYIETIESEG